MAGSEKIGIIGGSGLQQIPGLTIEGFCDIGTPFGSPSQDYAFGNIGDTEVVFLNRHGTGHTIQPSDLPNRANLWGFRQLGVRSLVAVSAVGSLREVIAPGDLVVPDQIIDFTRSGRPATFFNNITNGVGHVSMADPYCPDIHSALVTAGEEIEPTVHDGGTLVVMEGPQFSTRAESEMYRIWGGDIIGMTAMPEAKLARELGICYTTLALSTDYDSWRPEEEGVQANEVAEVMAANVHHAAELLGIVLPKLAERDVDCTCRTQMQHALFSDTSQIPGTVRARYSLLLGDLL